MSRRFGLRNCKSRKLQIPQRGYMLITLMLFVALAAMSLLAVLPAIDQQIRRDREEEMCHRGTAYMRAIQHYFKKFGRFPSRIEELENTNNIRFLRKRYKDPLNRDPKTGKERDFKLLHPQDISLNNGPALGPTAGAPPPGASPQPQSATATQKSDEEDEPEPGVPANPQANPNSPSPSAPTSTTGSSTSSGFSGPVFGGGPIVGVASMSKAKSIREFNKKDHYKDWIFIYDQTSDRGGLLVGPWQAPTIQGIPGATPAAQPGFGVGPAVSQPGGGQAQGPQQPPQNQSQNPEQ
jgi:type II secretory pathway pseudopilin PulG